MPRLPSVRARAVTMMFLLAVANVLVWVWAWAAFDGSPALLGKFDHAGREIDAN